MNRIKLTLSALVSASLVVATPAGAQQFGRAVAIDGDDVLILKTGTGRGPAAAYVYSAGEDGWLESARLGTEVTGLTGHGLSPSIWAGGGMAVLGSGDPDEAAYALAYRRTADGDWGAVSSIARLTGQQPADGQTAMDLEGLMRVLRPPQRLVAADGDLLIVATLGQGAGRVDVLRMHGENGAWEVEGSLAAEQAGVASGFGASIAAADGRVFVGAPRQDDGVVYVFESGADGWEETGRIEADGLGEVRRFGSAIAADAGDLYVGAPGSGSDAGQVVVMTLSTDGSWTETGRLSAPDASGRDLFGRAVAWGGSRLWIGAPGAAESAGRIYAFVRTSAGDLVAADDVPSPDLDPGDRFGSSVAASPSLVVAGAPFSSGGVGSAVVYSSRSGAWSAQTLEPAGQLSSISDGEVRCADGDAAGFSCSSVDLLSFLTIDALGGGAGERVSDLWGWTDPETGREYALVGRTGGLVIVDITDPAAPHRMGIVPANPSGARDIKVYSDHVFFTGDGAQDHGLIVFDLTRLRAVDETPADFEPDARYEGIQSAHNLAIDTESGFAFAVGASGGGETCGGGLHMVDIRSPKDPTFAGCYTDTEGLIWAGRTHDTQCVVYHGPDTDHVGRQLCFASNETALRIVDVTDKQNPVPIAAASYPGQAYIHQGWLTEDHQYFYLDDELDEIVGTTTNTRTLVWDLTDLDDPTYGGELVGTDAATDHNLYIKGSRMYQANYRAGLRVVDISDPTAPFEVGHFDTTPYGANPPGFSGAWTAFPFFESGTVIVTSMNEGLFILRPERPLVP
ncbi:MAG: choice-of-anchor B family protein [Gemmatimonadota bacterium]